MGTWSTGIYDDDEAQDARDAYREILGDGLDGTKATDRFLKQWKGEMKDSDDGPVIWFALADTQWTLGRLEDRVRDEVIRIIDDGSSLDRWREAGEKILAKRQKVLLALKDRLLSPQPKRKTIAQKKRLKPVSVGKQLKPAELRQQLKAMHCSLEPGRGNALTSIVCRGGMTDLLLANLEICANTLEKLHIENSDGVSDDGLRTIGQLKHLKSLCLRRLSITDAGLSHLRDLDQLIRLEVTGNSHVSDAGVAQFSKCTRLQYLELGGTSVSDKTLLWIAKLEQLTELWLRRTAVTDHGIAALKNHPRLEKLFLASTKITDKGVCIVASLPKLQWLDLENTCITDKVISALSKSHSLRALDLRGTAVTDKCVPELLKLAPFEYLDVDGTKISPKGRAQLEESATKKNR